MNARQRRVARRKAGRKVVTIEAVRLMIDGILIKATPNPGRAVEIAREEIGRFKTGRIRDEPECSHLWIAETRTLDRCVRCGEVK